MSETTRAVLFVALLSLACGAGFVRIFWGPGRKEPGEAPAEPEAAQAKANFDPAATRHNAAMIFIGFLIGLAYQEAVTPVRAALDGGDFGLTTAGLVTAFFFYGLSTFFGGFYHLLVAPWTGVSWVSNFLVIVLSAVILVFMAGVCTEQASARAEWGLFTWALIYTALMTAWAIAISCYLVVRTKKKGKKTTAATVVSIADTVFGAALVGLIVVAFSDVYALAPALLLAAVVVLRFGRDVQVLIKQKML